MLSAAATIRQPLRVRLFMSAKKISHFVTPWRQNVCCRLSAWPGGHRLKETRRAVSLGAVENLDQGEDPEVSSGHEDY
jgi:hypothetical protein